MTRLLRIFFVVWTMLLTQATSAQTSQFKALIVYDAPKDTEFGKLGQAYAIMLANLLGHFDSIVTQRPVHLYDAGEVDKHDVTFYLGASYGTPLPEAFLKDAYFAKKTVVWFRHNFWQLTRHTSYDFQDRFGFTFQAIRGLNAAPSNMLPNPGFFSRVIYKGRMLDKFYEFDPKSQKYNGDPDIGMVRITDSNKARMLVPIKNVQTEETIPYIVRSKNFWYVADIPLSFIGPRDRYLVLADILHDMVGVDHAPQHKAMIRLEDINMTSPGWSFDRVTGLLQQRNIPFSVAAIPHYMSPLGERTADRPHDVPLAQASRLQSMLKMAVERGGDIVAHGLTHQYANVENPHSATSGDDYEFWDVRTQTPVAEDSVSWATQRMEAALLQFRNAGFKPVGWGTPHYQGSPSALRASAKVFGTVYERAFYYTSDKPNLKPGLGRDFAVDQFFPYGIKRDYYGRRVIPENLGNIRYASKGGGGMNAHNESEYSWRDLLANARYALVVRDGVASFFYHPFLVEPVSGVPGEADLIRLLDGIEKLGFTWTSPRFMPH